MSVMNFVLRVTGNPTVGGTVSIPAIHRMMATGVTTHHALPRLWISASNEGTAKLSLDKKSGHLFTSPLHLTFTPSLSYTRPLQNSKAATPGVKPTHLLCISVEEVGGPTTTTPPPLHLHSTTTPPSSLSPPSFNMDSDHQLQSKKKTSQQIRD